MSPATKALWSIYRPSLIHPLPFQLDFLLPPTTSLIRKPHGVVRHTSSSTTSTPTTQSSITDHSPPSSPSSSPSQPSPHKKQLPPLTPHQTSYLTSALRVNQAGELAATLIYASQTAPLLTTHPHLRSLLHHMYTQEASHLTTFNDLCAKHRIRPTAMTPLWRLAAGALGWGTAMMGREAAMACTEAVETEIGEHYNAQVRELVKWKMEAEAEAEGNGGEEEGAKKEGLGEELMALLEDVRRIRDEELEHLDEAVDEDAKEAQAYPVLNWVVRAGCRGAIWVSEKV